MDHVDWGYTSKIMELEDDFYFDYGTEEINDQDPNELLAAFKQKEEEVILAAQLGNALLSENRQLKEQSEKLHEQYADRLEELEQGRHELRLRLEGCRSQWESQVGDLERDLRELGSQVERLTHALSEAEGDKARALMEHNEQTRLLREQISTAIEVEQVMSSELQALKQELRHKGTHSRPQDEELISAMREQVARLTQNEQTLDKRLESVCQENAELRASLASLHTHLAFQEQHKQQHSQQLAEARREVEEARSRSQQLQAQVEEMLEEVSFQEASSHRDTSLLSELQSSLDTMGPGVSIDQLAQDVHAILQVLLPLTQERSVQGGVDGQEDLQVMLHQLKGVARNLASAHGPEEMNQSFVERLSDPCGNIKPVPEMRDQILRLEEQSAELRQRLECQQQQAEVVQQAIRDRDDAIAKKNLMEAELVRSKNEMMSLNNQLLEAIQRKLELSQELEAWQDDIQIVINQQLKSQQQLEHTSRRLATNSKSFFRQPSIAPATRTHQSSLHNSWEAEASQEKSHAPWREWLRWGKVTQTGK